MGTNGASVLDGLTSKQISRYLSIPSFVEDVIFEMPFVEGKYNEFTDEILIRYAKHGYIGDGWEFSKWVLAERPFFAEVEG